MGDCASRNLAFYTELIVQGGCTLFRMDEAILSLEWISNECLICCYDAIDREFAWVNRPYMSRPAMCTTVC